MVQSCFVGMIPFDVQSSASEKASMSELVCLEGISTNIGGHFLLCLLKRIAFLEVPFQRSLFAFPANNFQLKGL